MIHYFLKVFNQLHETMPSYAELVFHIFKMSSAVDCRGSKLITPDYYWLGDSCMAYELSLPTAPDIGAYPVTSVFCLQVVTFNVFKISLNLKLIESILLLQTSWRSALA